MKTSIFLSLLSGLLLFSCNSDETVNANTVELTLSFSHLVDGSPVQLDQLIYKNALDQDFSIKTIKYFISGLKLYNEDQSVIEFADIHYVDVRLAETLTHILKIPPGNYTGLTFIYGLAPEENTTGRFTAPPESLMEWPTLMGGGYHYMKLEGEYKTPTEENFFNFHAGMLDGTAYEIHVDLKNYPFTASETKMNLTLNMEIQHWFDNPTAWDFTYFGAAIMGNHEAQKTIQENGHDVFSLAITETI